MNQFSQDRLRHPMTFTTPEKVPTEARAKAFEAIHDRSAGREKLGSHVGACL